MAGGRSYSRKPCPGTRSPSTRPPTTRRPKTRRRRSTRPRGDAADLQGRPQIPDRATFEMLARRDDVPGQLGAEELKFLMLGVDGPAPSSGSSTPTFPSTTTTSRPRRWASGSRWRSSTPGPTSGTIAQPRRNDHRPRQVRAETAGRGPVRDGVLADGSGQGPPRRARLRLDHRGDAVRRGADCLPPGRDTQEALLREERRSSTELGVQITTAELFANVAYRRSTWARATACCRRRPGRRRGRRRSATWCSSRPCPTTSATSPE